MPITSTGAIYYFKDDLGNPLIGGKVYTYEYNTSQPKDTYKTGARITPHTNPVILNDSGSVEWYLKGDYTIRVYTSEDVFVEEFNIVSPSKVQVDEVSDSLNLLKSELKNAAYHDTGTAAAQVPLNSDLGTAAYKDVTQDANGFIRDASSEKQAAVADASGVVVANGIQAGVGAPKVAYKKVTGTMPSDGTLQVPHGLNDSKILDYNILVSAADGKTASYRDSIGTFHNFKAHIESSRFHITVTTNSNQVTRRPFRIIITYEV